MLLFMIMMLFCDESCRVITSRTPGNAHNKQVGIAETKLVLACVCENTMTFSHNAKERGKM